MAERLERHRRAWTAVEIRKLHTLAKKGMSHWPPLTRVTIDDPLVVADEPFDRRINC